MNRARTTDNPHVSEQAKPESRKLTAKQIGLVIGVPFAVVGGTR